MDPKGKPLGWGALGEFLHKELKIGEQASVVNLPHRGHVDAELYEKRPDGRIYRIEKVHLDPGTLKEK